MAHPTDWTCYICEHVNPASKTLCANSATHHERSHMRDTITKEAIVNQIERESMAERAAENAGQGILVIAVAPKVWNGATVALCWWPRSGGEYITWTVYENGLGGGFDSGQYMRCSELEAWEAFYRRLLD